MRARPGARAAGRRPGGPPSSLFRTKAEETSGRPGADGVSLIGFTEGFPRAGARDDGAGGRRGVANAEHRGRPAKALEAAAVAGTPARLTTLRLGLWLVAALLAARQVAVVLTSPRGERLTDLETWVGPDGVLRVSGSLYDSTSFTGTPFNGLVLKPF